MALRPVVFNGEERAFIALLQSRGIDAQAVVRDDMTIDWSRFDRVLLRSTWV